MPFPLPVPPWEYDDETRAVIAGYLLYHRQGTLDALRSMGSVQSGTTFDYAEQTYRYYAHAEAYSRFLLYWLGYTVPKDQMYAPPTD